MTYQELIDKYNIYLAYSHVSPTNNSDWKKIMVNLTLSAWQMPCKSHDTKDFTYYTGGYIPKKDTILKSALECIKNDIETSLMTWEDAEDICPDKLDRLNMLESATQTYKEWRKWNPELIRELLTINED